MDSTIRRPIVRIEVIRWDFTTGSQKDTNPIDITDNVFSYSWSKSIKSPSSSCTINLLPQTSSFNLMDNLSPNDVINIYEFNILKFQGYIVDLDVSMYIGGGDSGTPIRHGILSVSGFGNLITTASLGLNLGNFHDNFAAFASSSAQLAVNLNSILLNTSHTYADFLIATYSSWNSLIRNIGAPNFSSYINNFIDFSWGIDTSTSPSYPENLYLWTGSENSITFWQCIARAVQIPFNEFWFDNGPRPLYLSSQSPSLQLTDNLTYAVFRPTPFNGRVDNGVESKPFSNLSIKKIKKNGITRIDLKKTSSESYTVYNVVTPTLNVSTPQRASLGLMQADTTNLNKYLLRMLISELYFSRQAAAGTPSTPTESDPDSSKIGSIGGDYNQTLLNWFTNNDKYLSGAIMINVPSDAKEDVYIGERAQIEGVDGTFYVEGVSHSWQMPGQLSATLSVTRGWNDDSDIPISMKDAIFRRGIATKGMISS